MTFFQRVLAPKPVFFRRLQAGCFALAFLCLSVLVAPLSKPGVVQLTAACLYVGTTAAALVCQLTVDGRKPKPQAHGKHRAKRK